MLHQSHRMFAVSRQGHAMQADTDDEPNFNQLLKLRGKDKPLLLKWLERKEIHITRYSIQNEIIAIMASHVIRDLVSEIKSYATSTQISVTRNN